MSKAQQKGAYQLPNGMWGYRYTLTVNGKKKDVKRTKDTLGNPFKTEKSALKAREAAIIHEHTQREHKPIKNRLRFRRLALPP